MRGQVAGLDGIFHQAGLEREGEWVSVGGPDELVSANMHCFFWAACEGHNC